MRTSGGGTAHVVEAAVGRACDGVEEDDDGGGVGETAGQVVVSPVHADHTAVRTGEALPSGGKTETIQNWRAG